jgi:hypothetical protein
MKEYREKLFRHRAGRGIKLLVCAAVVLGIIAGIWLWSRNKTYEDYEVTASTERNDILNTQYEEYNGKILKYSRDGISCVNLKNEAVWSQTYNMQNPILDVCQNAVVVADQQGNEVYVFNEQGLQTQISTLLPVQQVSISAQGVTALLLNDSDSAWVYLYDAEGTKLAEARCSLEETGQPLSIGISSDGIKLAVSYLQVQNGSASSCMVFYNFGSVGGNFVDKIVASKIYEDTVIPRVKYLSDSVCVAVSNESIIYYEGKEIPEETAVVEVESEIRSIFFGEKTMGIVVDYTSSEEETAEDTENARYEIRLYDSRGNQTMKKTTAMTYSRVKLSGGNLIIYSENECEIYSERGVLKYSGAFDGVLADIYKGSTFRKYILVFSDRTEEIKLK